MGIKTKKPGILLRIVFLNASMEVYLKECDMFFDTYILYTIIYSEHVVVIDEYLPYNYFEKCSSKIGNVVIILKTTFRRSVKYLPSLKTVYSVLSKVRSLFPQQINNTMIYRVIMCLHSVDVSWSLQCVHIVLVHFTVASKTLKFAKEREHRFLSVNRGGLCVSV